MALPERLQADELIEIGRIKDDERVDFAQAVELFKQRDDDRRRPHRVSGPPRNEKGELIFPPTDNPSTSGIEPPRYVGQAEDPFAHSRRGPKRTGDIREMLDETATPTNLEEFYAFMLLTEASAMEDGRISEDEAVSNVKGFLKDVQNGGSKLQQNQVQNSQPKGTRHYRVRRQV